MLARTSNLLGDTNAREGMPRLVQLTTTPKHYLNRHGDTNAREGMPLCNGMCQI
jgi:hypothetical protein